MSQINLSMRIYNFFYSPKFWILRHFLFWFFFYTDEILSVIGLTEPLPIKDIALSMGLDMLMVYINLYYLIPKFFNREKMTSYILLTGLSILLNITFVLWLTYDPLDYEVELDLIYDIMYTLIYTSGLLGLSLAIKISKINYTKQEELRKLEEMKHAVELDNLKKQINPHFLFNVLNNMYVQSKSAPDTVPDTILKLSDLMRFQTYDASKESVSLYKEIEFLQQYVDFELMRRENLEVNISQQGDTRNLLIAPLLFLPFVENACKHSATSEDKKSWINISWDYVDGNLSFRCQNSLGNRSGFINDKEYSGFGLDNVKKRLQLLFPEKHSLKITEETDTFTIHLDIQL